MSLASQSIFASPLFRGNSRYLCVAIESPDGDDDRVRRGEVRLLLKTY